MQTQAVFSLTITINSPGFDNSKTVAASMDLKRAITNILKEYSTKISTDIADKATVIEYTCALGFADYD